MHTPEEAHKMRQVYLEQKYDLLEQVVSRRLVSHYEADKPFVILGFNDHKEIQSSRDTYNELLPRVRHKLRFLGWHIIEARGDDYLFWDIVVSRLPPPPPTTPTPSWFSNLIKRLFGAGS